VRRDQKSTPQKQTLILWALLVRDGSAAFQKDLKPEPSKSDRETLEKAGLITAEKRKGGFWLEVTEKGWAWAAEHLDHQLPSGSTAGSPILQGWLTRLKAYMDTANVSLAEVLRPQPPPGPAAVRAGKLRPVAPAYDYAALRTRIRQAYLAVTGHQTNTRARLSHVREKLSDIDRTTLDEALKRMQLEQLALLYPLDNKREITDADRNAAIYFGDEPRHILWIERGDDSRA
jgi:hypothetical protein